jgi:hypothetical protein
MTDRKGKTPWNIAEQENAHKQIKDRKNKFTEERCPVCGEPLVDDRSGIWCVNPDCEVLDDYAMYDETHKEGAKP